MDRKLKDLVGKNICIEWRSGYGDWSTYVLRGVDKRMILLEGRDDPGGTEYSWDAPFWTNLSDVEMLWEEPDEEIPEPDKRTRRYR